MTSFKQFGSKPVVKYAYIGISADRQRHNLLWLLYKNKYRIYPIRTEIIHGGLNIYWFYNGLALYADILPLAIAHGKIFDITRGKISIYSSPHELFLNFTMTKDTFLLTAKSFKINWNFYPLFTPNVLFKQYEAWWKQTWVIIKYVMKCPFLREKKSRKFAKEKVKNLQHRKVHVL